MAWNAKVFHDFENLDNITMTQETSHSFGPLEDINFNILQRSSTSTITYNNETASLSNEDQQINTFTRDPFEQSNNTESYRSDRGSWPVYEAVRNGTYKFVPSSDRAVYKERGFESIESCNLYLAQLLPLPAVATVENVGSRMFPEYVTSLDGQVEDSLGTIGDLDKKGEAKSDYEPFESLSKNTYVTQHPLLNEAKSQRAKPTDLFHHGDGSFLDSDIESDSTANTQENLLRDRPTEGRHRQLQLSG
jgi:hypothetical protein